ncbi:MAG: trigger factor [Mogibacterium sp.]|nr:trigger factor [Mogibacterium sp.]
MKAYNSKLGFRIPALAVLMLMMLVLTTSCGSKAQVPGDYDYEDYTEYIKLAEYKGLEYETPDSTVTDAEVRDYIDQALVETGTTTQNTEGTVEPTSIINIDYSGSLDGVEFDGGSAEDVELNIADNNYIDGFAEGIIGHKAGESFDLPVTFPENYGNADLAGKEAVFKITINYILVENVPEYNEDWVKNNTDYSTVKEYEDSIRADLLASKESSAEGDARVSVFNQIFDGTEVIKYPDKELKDRKTKLVSSYMDYAEASGMEFADFLQQQMGVSEEEFNNLAQDAAETAVKRELILNEIVRLEEIEVSPDDYNGYLLGLLEDAGYTEDSYEEEKGVTIQEYAEENDLYTTYLYKKVMDKVMEYSVGK